MPFIALQSLLSHHSTCSWLCNLLSDCLGWDTYLIIKSVKKDHPLNSSNVRPVSTGLTFLPVAMGHCISFELYIPLLGCFHPQRLWFTVQSFMTIERADSAWEAKRESLSYLYNSCTLRPSELQEQDTDISHWPVVKAPVLVADPPSPKWEPLSILHQAAQNILGLPKFKNLGKETYMIWNTEHVRHISESKWDKKISMCNVPGL